jgi:predicted short-subunit dehydrogenase-like oxidoreductase (DUF2520 family)
MRKVAIVGIGRLGGALALALSRKGFDAAYLVHRSDEIALGVAAEMTRRPVLIDEVAKLGDYDPEIIIITTGDPEINSIADELATALTGTPTVLHTSGSLSSEILYGLADIGCSTGSIHPLISISDYSIGETSFEGAYFCVEGDAIGHSVGADIAKALGGMPFVLDTTKKALYHAAAVMACGHVTALIDLANTMAERCGIEGQDASQILVPLIQSTIENIRKHGTAAALTGSFARGDAGAVHRHIAAIEQEMGSETLEIYRSLGEFSLQIAERNSVDRDRIDEVRKLIKEHG